jgi:cytochrome b561
LNHALFAVPLTAIFGAWLEGHPLTFLAGLHIQSPISAVHSLGAAISNIHTLLGDAILWLAGFHALAAIFHHVFLKDDVLNAMLPRWFSQYVAVRGARTNVGAQIVCK